MPAAVPSRLAARGRRAADAAGAVLPGRCCQVRGRIGRAGWLAGPAGRRPRGSAAGGRAGGRPARSCPARSWSPSACAARAEVISRRAAMSLRCCCHSPARDGSSAAACSVSSSARSRSPALYASLAATAARFACTRAVSSAAGAGCPACWLRWSRCAAMSAAQRSMAASWRPVTCRPSRVYASCAAWAAALVRWTSAAVAAVVAWLCCSRARWCAVIAARRRSLAARSASSTCRRMSSGSMSCQRPAFRPSAALPGRGRAGERPGGMAGAGLGPGRW